jgi:AraC-like DNA-binding protein
VKDGPPDATARRVSPPWVLGLEFHGLEQLRKGLKGGAPLLVSTSAERLSGRLWVVDLGGYGLTGGTLDGPAWCAGLCPPDVISATVVTSASAGGGINGAPLDEGAFLLYPPRGYYEGWSPAGYRWISAFVPQPEAQRLLRAASSPLPTMRGASVLRSRVSQTELEAIRAFERDLELDRPRASPEALPVEDAAAFADLWRRILVRGWTHAAAIETAAARRRGESALRSADRYLREHLPDAVYLEDLSRATGTPARTLEHLFRRRLGLTPMSYLTWLRMAAAHRRLSDRRHHGPSAVTETAHAVGFSHAGRFAAAYRRTFGESPQDTVATNASRRRRAPASAGPSMGPSFDPAIEPAPPRARSVAAR